MAVSPESGEGVAPADVDRDFFRHDQIVSPYEEMGLVASKPSPRCWRTQSRSILLTFSAIGEVTSGRW
jgi:hypothetical protein